MVTHLVSMMYRHLFDEWPRANEAKRDADTIQVVEVARAYTSLTIWLSFEFINVDCFTWHFQYFSRNFFAENDRKRLQESIPEVSWENIYEKMFFPLFRSD